MHIIILFYKIVKKQKPTRVFTKLSVKTKYIIKKC